MMTPAVALRERSRRRSSEPALPNDVVVEASILGGIILRNDVLPDLAELEVDNFYDYKHRVVFEAMRNLEAAGKPIDVATLGNEIAKAGKLEAIGGPGFFGELALNTPTVDNVLCYATIIREHSRNRQLAIDIGEAAVRVRKQPDEAVQIAADLTERLTRLRAPTKQHAATKTVCLGDVAPEQVRWLWPARVPFGMLTLIDGDPGLGKSTVTLDLAARVTTGAAMPCDPNGYRRPPASVVLLTAEDHLAATVRPRLDVADADVRRVHAITAMPRRGDPDAPATLAPEDVSRLESVIVEFRAELVIVDPLMAFLPGEIDAYRDQDVRRTLRPLAAVAERTGAAIVIVRHLRKGSGTALYRGGGSIGIVGAARSALMVAVDPDDDGARVIAPSKSNLSQLAPALRWRLVDVGGVARVEWLGVADGVTADDLAQVTTTRDDDEQRSAIDAAADALRELLEQGKRRTTEVEKDVRAMTGASPITIQRARAKAGVKALREGGHWYLYIEQGNQGRQHHDGDGLEAPEARNALIQGDEASTVKAITPKAIMSDDALGDEGEL